VKVLHTISGIWKHTGGPAESVPRLCSALVKDGVDISIMTLNGELSNAALESQSDGVEIISLPHYKQMSLKVFDAATRQAKQCDIVHGHGLWLPLNWAAGRAALKNKKPFIITTRGALNPNALKRSRLKKQLVGSLFDNRYLNSASCIHVTSNDEYLAIRNYGLKNPVAMIPNGVHVEKTNSAISVEQFRHTYGIPKERKVLLFISRISWEKGLEDLAEAWGKVGPDFDDWQLLIVGQGEAKYVSTLKQSFGSGPAGDRVTFTGPLFGDEKTAAYASANLFVLPSHTENFSLVTAEALAAGIPAITTQGTPWSTLVENRCGWWVPVGPEGITMALHESLNTNEIELKTMGRIGKALIDNKYSWPVIAKQMEGVYDWVLGCRDEPECIIRE